MTDLLNEVKQNIHNSEKVLVGIGEALEYDWHDLSEDPRYQEIEKEIGGDLNKIWVIPFLQKMILREKRDSRLNETYQTLKGMLSDKDYYIVSTCMDDYLSEAGFRPERIVAPCGGFDRMQCDQHCTGELSEMPEHSYEDVVAYYRGEKKFAELHEPKCDKCGASLRFNQIGVTKYAEEGYLERWNDYTRWLQGTVNRKLCILELGVGMAYPSVIRFPVEKMVFYNQKAFLYRVHPFIYQIGESIAERGKGIPQNPTDFLCGSR